MKNCGDKCVPLSAVGIFKWFILDQKVLNLPRRSALSGIDWPISAKGLHCIRSWSIISNSISLRQRQLPQPLIIFKMKQDTVRQLYNSHILQSYSTVSCFVYLVQYSTVPYVRRVQVLYYCTLRAGSLVNDREQWKPFVPLVAIVSVTEELIIVARKTTGEPNFYVTDTTAHMR